MERRDFYVYAYFDPTSDTPFYIGRGTKYRDVSHLTPAELRKPSFFHNKLAKLLTSGHRPLVVRLLSDLTHEESNFWEQFFIVSLGRRNDANNLGPLCNLTNGGDGNKGYRATEETRLKNAKRAQGNTNRRGQKHNDEARRKIKIARASQVITETHKAALRVAFRGRTHTDAARELMRVSATGRTHTNSVKQRIAEVKRKPIVIDGIEYRSGQHAAACLGVSTSTVSRLRRKAA